MPCREPPPAQELLRELCRIDGLRWIRMLYCYPEHMTDELLDVMAEEEKDRQISGYSHPALQ